MSVSSSIERLGINAVEKRFIRLGWIFREQPKADFGVDANVEYCIGDVPQGRLLALQIKSGISWFGKPRPSGFLYRGSLRHLEYWTRHSLPVVLVLYHPDLDEAFWTPVTADNVRRAEKGWRIIVPAHQKLNVSSNEALRELATPDFRKRRKLNEMSVRLSAATTSLGTRLPACWRPSTQLRMVST